MLLSETLVTQLMTRQPVTVEPDASVDEALRLLGRYPFRHLPVARGDEVCGILSDRDLLLATGWMSNAERSIQDDPRPVGPATVSDVMRVDVRTAEPGTTVGEATSILLEERIGALPVVDERGLAGIVTETDLLEAFQDDFEGSGVLLGVEALMHTPVETIEEDADVLEAAESLFSSHIRHLPVMRDGKLVGVLSDRDVRLGLARIALHDARAQVSGELDVPRLIVADVMTSPPWTVSPRSSLSRAVHCMVEERLGALPVVRGSWLVGILSRTDVLRLLAHSHRERA